MSLQDKVKMAADNPRYVKENITVITATLFVAFSGYIFHFMTAKELGPSSYGLIVSLLAIVYLVDIFLQSLQSTIATKIAEARFEGKDYLGLLKFFLRTNLKWAIISSLSFVALTPALAIFFHTNDYLTIFLLSVLIFATFLLSVTRGFFQGIQRFGMLAMTYFAEGITKVIVLKSYSHLEGTLPAQ